METPEPTAFYAHTHPEFRDDPSKWEPLFTPFGDGVGECGGRECKACRELDPYHGHLNKVAWWAAKFASQMFADGSEEAEAAWKWGWLAGLWHDLGKFAPEWQEYLKKKAGADFHGDEVAGKVDHSTAGAAHGYKKVPLFGTLVAYLIAGHHGGLADGIDATDSNLKKRLAKRVAPYLDHTPPEVLSFNTNLPLLPFALSSPGSLSVFLRMLFACLVDADFLATEAFMSAERSRSRDKDQVSIPDLEKALNQHLDGLTANAKTSSVNSLRAEILSHCRAAAEQSPGLFSLTVPTGGGKTLSSLAFALKHARIHGLRRVIYVIPFTSIIEQNAAVFRKALASLGPDVVVEHHSNLDPDAEQETSRNRLAAENWDARVIVTTNVQFYESLHANRTSRCRKLHRIARSVVILDEAQSLPVEFLAPCLRALDELHSYYGTSVVLCTATQPAIQKNADFTIGLGEPREIICDPDGLYTALRRVQTGRIPGKIDDTALAGRLSEKEQVLAIVNTRRHARELFELLPNDGSRFHLSALMCPEHRRDRLRLVKERLDQGLPVRLVSTQLIEAGVDIDFPVVYRSLAGLDSIAQAAGRCDREGRLTASLGKSGGRLFIFESADHSAPPFIRTATNSTIQTLASDPPDPLGLETIHHYFDVYYGDSKARWDREHILENVPKHIRSPDDMLGFRFKKTAHDFKLIDDYTEPVIIPFGERGRDLCDRLRDSSDPAEIRRLSRMLQRFTVNITTTQHADLLRCKILLPLLDSHFFLLHSDLHYSDEFGLHPHPDLFCNLICE